MINILVVDDEARMRKIIKDFLKLQGYNIIEAEDGERAIEIFAEQKEIDLVLLDIMMPKMNGWEVCKFIRKSSNVPIVMLTALDGETDELTGFKLGVDEYISKPFSPKILVARVNAILKRAKTLQGEINREGGLEINKEAHTVTAFGKPVELSFKEFELLTFMIENKGLALSRDKILDNVWNYDYFGDVRTIDTHVKKLRSKLFECSKYIKTVRGIGYKFEVCDDSNCGEIDDEE